MDCRRNQRRIEIYFASGLSPLQVAELRAHTRGCEWCRRFFDRAGSGEAALHGDATQLYPRRHAERLMEEIFSTLQTDAAPKRSPWRWWLLRLAPAALLLTLIAVPLSRWLAPRSSGSVLHFQGHTLQVRGFLETGQAQNGAGVRAFCLLPVQRGAQIQSVDISEIQPRLERPPGAARCPLDGLLFFTATNLLSAPRQVFVFGLDEQLEARWYYPKPREASSRRVEPGALDEPLGRGIQLQVNHAPGGHRLFALIAPEEIPIQAVVKAMEELRSRGLGLAEIEAVPIEGVLYQLRFDLEIEEGR